MRIFLSLLLCLSCVGCRSIGRLIRNSPLSGVETAGDRINLWPFYYQAGDRIAVLWPVFDDDEKGFALRPLVTRDGTHWEVLWPVAWWDAESGDWTVLTAYSRANSFGVLPLFGAGDFSYAGPVWWNRDQDDGVTSGGFFPLMMFSDELNYVGPFWWNSDAGSLQSYGLFPLVDIGHGFNNIGPVFWGYDDDALDYAIVFPLFGYGRSEGEGGLLLTPVGGRGWDADGETSFINVLGPVFHYDREGENCAIGVLWPLFWRSDGTRYAGWGSWPLVGRGVYKDEFGNVTSTETTAFAGLFRHAVGEVTGEREATPPGAATVGLRFLPLFSYRTKDGGGETPLDWLSFYGYKEHHNGDTALHIATPMVFNYRGGERGFRFSSLLGTISYETEDEKSEFSLLYYLYRQKTEGTETRRDFFPFFTWDSGEQRSGFSFLWRLFNWQRDGDKVGGHVFFIPWGDL